MDVVDAVVAVILVGSAIHGIRVGALAQLAWLVGFAAGLSAGVGLVLLTAPHIGSPQEKTLVALLLLIVPTALLSHLGHRVGMVGWHVARRHKLGALDSVVGLFISAASALIACWLFASVVVNSGITTVSNAVSESRAVRAIADVMPPVPNAFASVQRYLTDSGFPEVLANVVPQSLAPVQVPNAATVASTASSVRDATVRVQALGCGDIQEGSGFVAGDGLVVTNAHVIAGTSMITVATSTGASYEATPVYFNPEFDLALLRATRLKATPLPLDTSFVGRGEPAVVIGYPEAGPYTAVPAGIVTRFEAQGRDIYDEDVTDRTVYELDATVLPGNSGGPLVTPGGEVIGVVFSRSVTDPSIGYALASPAVAAIVNAPHGDAAVSTQTCTD